jgi:hypothetical protein
MRRLGSSVDDAVNFGNEMADLVGADIHGEVGDPIGVKSLFGVGFDVTLGGKSHLVSSC